MAPSRNSLRRGKSSGSLGVADTEAEPSGVCTENLIPVDDVMESPKLAE